MDAAYLGIDPGTHQSGFCALVPGENAPQHFGVFQNSALLAHTESVLHDLADKIPSGVPVRVGVEMIACYGMPVGRETFETCLWIGKFVAFFPRVGCPVEIRKVYRREVKHHLCNSVKAKDANVRQALIDKYPATGGGRIPQVGTKKQPGPLYGLKSHIWAALGEAVTARDTWADLETFLQTEQTKG